MFTQHFTATIVQKSNAHNCKFKLCKKSLNADANWKTAKQMKTKTHTQINMQIVGKLKNCKKRKQGR